MENNRDDTVVIFAGYPDKIERFLEKNSRLYSRIAFHVDFPDYNLGLISTGVPRICRVHRGEL